MKSQPNYKDILKKKYIMINKKLTFVFNNQIYKLLQHLSLKTNYWQLVIIYHSFYSQDNPSKYPHYSLGRMGKTEAQGGKVRHPLSGREAIKLKTI